jgi:hypothetical protein
MPDDVTIVDASMPVDSSEPTLVADPLADLLLSTVAIIVLAMIAILPTLPRHHSQAKPKSSITGLPDTSTFRVGGQDVEPMVATAAGLITLSSNRDLIPIGHMFFDKGLVAKLEDMRRLNQPLVLLIEPSGSETAFQFEVLANRHGPKRITQVRLDTDCGHAKSAAVEPYCNVQASQAEGARP